MLKLRKLNVTWVVLLTVSVSSCKDGDKKRRSENKKEVSIFIPIGLKDCVHLFGKSSTGI
jgi:hypothetical protein